MKTTEWGKPGNFAIMGAFAMMVTLGFTAFVLNVGILYWSKDSLQNTADAAALSAARELNGKSTGISKARTAATALVNANDPQRKLAFDANRDIVFGLWAVNNQTGEFEFTPQNNALLVNAVKLTIERSVARGNAVMPVMGGVIGDAAGADLRGLSTVYSVHNYGDPTDTIGVIGGHFDAETSTYKSGITPSGGSCPYGQTCFTSKHKHAYDNTFNLTSWDPLSPSGDQVSLASSVSTNGGDSFKIIVANSSLSPGVDIQINGVKTPIKQYAAIPYDDLPSYTVDSLKELKLIPRFDAITEASLHRTQTSCVRTNNPGAKGEWRNGALTVQAISTTLGTIDKSIPAAGGQGVADDGLLFETNIYWHGPGHCYDHPDWENEWASIGVSTTSIVK